VFFVLHEHPPDWNFPAGLPVQKVQLREARIMVPSLPLPVQNVPGRVCRHHGLVLVLMICTVFLRLARGAGEKEKPGPDKKAAREVDAKTLATGLAARIVAGGNGPGSIGLLLSGRQMALWGDWQAKPQTRRPDAEKAPSLDPRWFGVIRDLKPFDGSWAANRELKLRNTVLVLAAQTSPDAMARSALETRDATVENMLRDPRRYRGKVVRVRGRLKHLWVEEAPASLKNQGIEKVYEGWIFTDDLQSSLAAVTFSELPKGFKTGDDLNYPVEFDGYFLKKEVENRRDLRVMPLLVGQSVRRSKGPFPKAKTKGAPSVNHLLLNIKDGKPVPQTPDKDVEEVWGLTEILALAAKTPEKALEESAEKNKYLATFAHLLRDPQKYRGKVLLVKGRLGRLREFPAPEYLKARGIQVVYEGWIFLQRRLPWWVLFTELPPDIKVGEQLNYPVTFAGYFFKKIRYHTETEGDRFAPLLIGRTIHREGKTGSPGMPSTFSTGFVVGLTSLIGGTIFLVVALSWWFRRGDRRLHRRLATVQGQQVLEPSDEPVPENGSPGTGAVPGGSQAIGSSPPEGGRPKLPREDGFSSGSS
jgi:hypothetical protein